MITYYVARLSARGDAGVLRARLIDSASDWLADNYPMDVRADGVRVRVREAEDDPVWRIVVDDNRAHDEPATSTSVTVVRDDASGDLTAEVRCVAYPTGDAIGPRGASKLPPAHLLHLVAKFASIVSARDVGWAIEPRAKRLESDTDGRGLAAIVSLPTRRLPIVVYTPKPGTPVADFPAPVPVWLAANAHCVTLASADSVNGFASEWGSQKVQPGTIAIIWPARGGVSMQQVGGLSKDDVLQKFFTTARTVLEGAAESLGPVRLPISRPTTELGTGSQEDKSAEIAAALDAAYDQLEDLQSAMSVGEQMLIDKQDEVDALNRQLDELVLQNVDLALRLGRVPTGVRAQNMSDVLRHAKTLCGNLSFHPSLDDTIRTYQYPDPNKILDDLIKLNRVAGKWKSSEVPASGFGILCSGEALSYMSDVSQTAKQKFGEDYTFTWRGREYIAGEHLARGRGGDHCRIYFFRDPDTREVVICHIGRHLRDRTSR